MKKQKVVVFFLVMLFVLFTITPVRAVSDPSGEITGTAADLGVEVGSLTTAKLADFVGHNAISINFIWVLLTGFLVMFMQAGFALVETGFCRAKNAAETMMMNFMVYGLGMAGYWVCGYALQMGGGWRLRQLGGRHRPL